MAEGQKRLSEYETTCHQHAMTLSGAKRSKALERMDDSLQHLERDLVRIRSLLDDKEEEITQSQALLKKAGDRDVTTTRAAVPIGARRTFLERSKLPVFSGKVEEFPEFQKQFKELTNE